MTKILPAGKAGSNWCEAFVRRVALICWTSMMKRKRNARRLRVLPQNLLTEAVFPAAMMLGVVCAVAVARHVEGGITLTE